MAKQSYLRIMLSCIVHTPLKQMCYSLKRMINDTSNDLNKITQTHFVNIVIGHLKAQMLNKKHYITGCSISEKLILAS